MPRPKNLTDLEVDFSGGYFPAASALSPEGLQQTIRAGLNVWLRPFGRIEATNGMIAVSSTNVGARLFSLNTQRASIAGGLVSGRLPFAGIIRYQNAALFFLSEYTSAQVYLDETAVSGLTTSATAQQLRVAVPDGAGGFDVYDAGFDPPGTGTVALTTGGTKSMSGTVGCALAAWRTSTNAISAPSAVTYQNCTPSTADRITIVLPAAVSGQDGWIFCGTRWGDQSGEVRVVRYVYITPRGTFTATNGSPNLTAGVSTQFMRDLRAGDVVTIDGGSYTISSITSNTVAVLTGNFTGVTNNGKTMTITTAAADWYNSELGELIDRDAQKPPPAAGVFQYAGRVFLWGVGRETTSDVTGPAIIATLDQNPEHVGLFAITTASGSDLVNVLVSDNQLYLMTTTSLEAVTFTGDPDVPYVIRTLAEPGFVAATNGVIYKDYFYGFANRPMRTKVDANVDVEFAAPVATDMADWTAQRVMVAVDPQNEAVLYMHDDLSSTTTVIPYMAQLGVWGPPIVFSNRFTDAAAVNGELYIDYISALGLGSNRIAQWEGGSGQSSPYVASQYYDMGDLFTRKRIKNLVFSGKGTTMYVFLATQGAAIPDVSNTADAAASFSLSGAERSESAIYTNLEGRAFAIHVTIPLATGTVDKIVVAGMPVSERR